MMMMPIEIIAIIIRTIVVVYLKSTVKKLGYSCLFAFVISINFCNVVVFGFFFLELNNN